MKVAIVQDSFLHIGGAEKVLIELIKIYPNSDLFVPLIHKKFLPILNKKFKSKLKTTFLSRLPFIQNFTSIFMPILILYFEKLNLDQYDLVISSSYSFNSKIITVKKPTIHVSYVHTPPKYLGNEYNESQFINKTLFKKIFSPLFSWLKNKDLISGKKPDLLIANSKTVQQRIKDRYNRKSIVVYPPIKIFSQQRDKPKYFITFSRLVKQKGVALAVEACTKLNLPLLVIGIGPETSNLKKIAGPTVRFVGFIKTKDLNEIFKHTIAMINCAIDEDFGMTAAEISSRGIPVIGYKSGALQEIIIEQKTGLLFSDYTADSLIKKIKQLQSMNFDSKTIINSAQKFSDRVFRKKITAIISCITTT